ncbi:hypothetical protein Egran_05083 [Elaphomyces granulatus]|uniref:Uncharacterized protein n=1 Tax=Elaphomyces granulatus TaxID=519963 RepID=A0A232LTJ1_9EURO|nr:hypothetical protein Egran_05083 [Elaphomyces granulatus]
MAAVNSVFLLDVLVFTNERRAITLIGVVLFNWPKIVTRTVRASNKAGQPPPSTHSQSYAISSVLALFRSTTTSTTKHHQQNAESSIDRTTLKPERSEQTKSGTDDEVASHPASFDPSKTDPECAAKATKRESQRRGMPGSPLDTSPVNRDVSKPRDPAEGGAERNATKERSAKGWTRKQKSTPRNHDG